MVDYKPLWHILLERGMTKTQLRKAVGMGPNTIAQMGRGEYISMANVEAICRFLGCTPNDIMRFEELKEVIPDEGDIN